MYFLRVSFSELFATTFVVGGTFQCALGFAGLIAAILNPSIFHSGTRQASIAAASPVQAIGILIPMLVAVLIVNLVVSAGGAALLVAASSTGLFDSRRKI